MTFTNMSYTEFDTTQQTLVSDLLDKILLSASWAKISSTSVLVTTATTATSAGGTVLTAASGSWATAGVVIGSVIRIGEKGAADCEYRTVTATTATTVTVAAVTYAHATGTNVYVGNEVLKATTTAGADMIVDLMDAHSLVTAGNLNMACYRSHTGAVGGGTDRTPRFLFWRNTTAAASNVLHVIVSVSKEHLFISIEGPRYNETGPDSATLGSARNYFFMCGITPYFVGDSVPSVFAGGNPVATLAGSFPNSLIGSVSRNAANTSSWVPARLQTLATPQAGVAGSLNVQRQAAGDGDWYVFPYVVLEDAAGIRGRLSSFFFAGYNSPDYVDTTVPVPPIGSTTTYSSQLYKLLAMNKTGTNVSCYAQFGIVANVSNAPTNIVVAVPSA